MRPSRSSSAPAFRLELVAPRLARAHRERRLELEQESAARIRAAQAVLKAERLVAHRELQLIRAGASSGRGRRHRDRYIAVRAVKLTEAREELEAARRRATALGVHHTAHTGP